MTSLQFSAVIFDLDGTLLDTLQDIAEASNEVMRRLGGPTHPIDAYRTLVGDGVSVLFQRAWPETRSNSTLLESAIEGFHQVYGQGWNKRSKPYEGIIDLLSQLSAAQLPLAVLSNKPDRSPSSASRTS